MGYIEISYDTYCKFGAVRNPDLHRVIVRSSCTGAYLRTKYLAKYGIQLYKRCPE